MTTTCYTTLESPVGRLMLAGDGERITRLVFLEGKKPAAPDARWRDAGAPFVEAGRQLRAYFAGELRDFDLRFAPDPPGTPFQQRVWTVLGSIPYGATMTYGEVARRIGNPTASRAVGLANGSNRLPIFLPCHRVIGAGGSLTGYGGGLPIKEHLLRLERALPVCGIAGISRSLHPCRQ